MLLLIQFKNFNISGKKLCFLCLLCTDMLHFQFPWKEEVYHLEQCTTWSSEECYLKVAAQDTVE